MSTARVFELQGGDLLVVLPRGDYRFVHAPLMAQGCSVGQRAQELRELVRHLEAAAAELQEDAP